MKSCNLLCWCPCTDYNEVLMRWFRFMINSVSTGRATTSTSAVALMFSSWHRLHLAFKSKRDLAVTHTVIFCCFSFVVSQCGGPSQDQLLKVMLSGEERTSLCNTLIKQNPKSLCSISLNRHFSLSVFNSLRSNCNTENQPIHLQSKCYFLTV